MSPKRKEKHVPLVARVPVLEPLQGQGQRSTRQGVRLTFRNIGSYEGRLQFTFIGTHRGLCKISLVYFVTGQIKSKTLHFTTFLGSSPYDRIEEGKSRLLNGDFEGFGGQT